MNLEEFKWYSSLKNSKSHFPLEDFLAATKKEPAKKQDAISDNCAIKIKSKTGRDVGKGAVWFAPGTRMQVVKAQRVPDGNDGFKYNLFWNETKEAEYLARA